MVHVGTLAHEQPRVLISGGLTKHSKTLEQVLGGRADANVRFEDLRALLLGLGFAERTRGSHHVFSKSGIEEQVNLQRDGAKAKPYQVKQVRAIISRYDLQES
jgi:predicted RNA binding protein YcfA (HicA-like mRNA interferase family)